ncbi:DUF3857 domain-containing transglutaminase family protein [Sphingomonas sp. AOB5]|uniref:DUF3857 domain-containing transglutaminase family protein n=1 Tax=Sphingomonas sp. AOB5 TaxID=3034017 RepID=UPI0023F94A67|nr:DUF3857 domain-containing transglutaminase family protein [Sphingomonas sp. AOB5]MDF7773970.1 DUF3857 domain-containing transglutaminase family protein [Sphingomonas sp. AOB5]
MRLIPALALPVALMAAPAAHSASRDVRYAAAPAWVLPPPSPTTGPAADEAPLRVIYTDTQVRAGRAGMEWFTGYRLKLLRPEALPAGNIKVVWNPDGGDATVHYLRIIRDGRVIDVLKQTRFRVLQREEALEQSMLSGLLTATLQAPGLQVGDEIEFAATIQRRDTAFGVPAFGAAQLPMQGIPGAYRFRLLWPENSPMHWRATADLPKVTPGIARGEKQLVYELRDPASIVLSEEAPARFNVRRLIEFSDFAAWADVSRRAWPLFDKAATLPANSPLRAEAAKIMASTENPAERAQAALRLVQDNIRYVYIGLDGGNYIPASAEETWRRRFGDCKGKTVVLLALLRLMGISAEPVLVNTTGSDGLNERLPQPSYFDHVLVRARIGERSYWLDGTRPADRTLAALQPPLYRWVLPLNASGSELESVPARPWNVPMLIGVVDVDATAGFDKPAKYNVQHIIRDDDAYQIRTQLGAMPASDADRAVRTYWRQQMEWVTLDKVSWRYDEARAALILTATGDSKPDWDGDEKEGRRLTIPGAGFVPPSELKRPEDQEQTVPWATDFPRYRCWATTIRLPAAGVRRRWTYHADPMNRQLGGIEYWRASGLRQNVMRTVMSRRTYLPEISAADAELLNREIPGFNNNMSSVYEEDGSQASRRTVTTSNLPFADDHDWLNNPAPCTASLAATSIK